MNYGELKTYIKAFTKRSDLTDTNFDIWQQNVNQKLLRDTDIVQMDRRITVSNPTGDTIFPIDTSTFLFMNTLLSVAITNTASGIPQVLQAVSWEQFQDAIAIGQANSITEPWCYCMFSTGLKVAPGNQEDFIFDIVFRAADRTMNNDDETNNYLSWAQPLYIEAMLVEVYKFMRDVEGEQLSTARYDAEVAKYNSYYRWQHSGANESTPKGAWSWA